MRDICGFGRGFARISREMGFDALTLRGFPTSKIHVILLIPFKTCPEERKKNKNKTIVFSLHHFWVKLSRKYNLLLFMCVSSKSRF